MPEGRPLCCKVLTGFLPWKKIVVLDEIRAKRQSTKLVTDDTWANLGWSWAVSGDGRIGMGTRSNFKRECSAVDPPLVHDD